MAKIEGDGNQDTGNGDSGNDTAGNQPDKGAAAGAAPAATPAPGQPKPETPKAADQGDGGKPPPPADFVLPPGPSEDVDVLVTGRIRDEVGGALELAEFIVKTGARKADGRSVPPELIGAIKLIAGKIRLLDPPAEPVHIKASEWTRFELAYYALVEFSSPVTIETLRNTRNTGKGAFLNASHAQKFTWLLWAITIGFALSVILAASIAVGAETGGRAMGGWARFARDLAPYVNIIIPFAYGGLGACAFLLRTAHNLIAERSFDVRRKPEYLNRILLGMVSGGAIVLLFAPDSEDDTVKISAAALGFIAGYSNDFLFNAIERVIAAVLPRVGLETVKKESVAAAPPPLELPTGKLTLETLLEKMEAAKGEDKELYKSLLMKLRDRL